MSFAAAVSVTFVVTLICLERHPHRRGRGGGRGGWDDRQGRRRAARSTNGGERHRVSFVCASVIARWHCVQNAKTYIHLQHDGGSEGGGEGRPTARTANGGEGYRVSVLSGMCIYFVIGSTCAPLALLARCKDLGLSTARRGPWICKGGELLRFVIMFYYLSWRRRHAGEVTRVDPTPLPPSASPACCKVMTLSCHASQV
mgnify:CR=1 FL=1